MGKDVALSASTQVETRRRASLAISVPELPLGEKTHSPELVYPFLEWLKRRMTMLSDSRLMDVGAESRNTAVDQVFVERMADGRGMIWGFGLSETGVEKLPTAPLLFSLLVGGDQVDEWDTKVEQGVAAKEMRKKVWEQVFAPYSKGTYFIDIHGWGETVANRMPDLREVQQGIVSAGGEGWVGIAISPYGALGTEAYVQDDPTMDDVVLQVKGSIEKTGLMLADEFGEDESRGSYEEDMAWRNLAAGIGHSMGGWVVANLLFTLKDSLHKYGNESVKWLLENPVIYGAHFTVVLETQVNLMLGIDTPNPDHVQLLKKFGYGDLVSRSPQLMNNRLVKAAAESVPVMEAIVQYYLQTAGIEYSEWKRHNQVWSAKNDPKFIAICNKLLNEAPCIVQSATQGREMKRLAVSGQLAFAIGDKDKVLTSAEQRVAAQRLGAQQILNTGSHTPKEGQGLEIGRMLVQGF